MTEDDGEEVKLPQEDSTQNPVTAHGSKSNLNSQPTIMGAASANEPPKTVPNTASVGDITKDPE